MTFRCVACSCMEGELYLADCKDYYLGKPFQPNYWRCAQCALVQQSPIPTDLARFYDAYPIHSKKSFAYRLFRKLVMSSVYYPVKTMPTGQTLLDYGCGDGWFLEANKKRGLNQVGFEANSDHARRLTQDIGISVFSDREALLAQYAGKIDVITLHFVMEHLPDLDAVFETARQLLRPNGVLYSVVPNIDSMEARLFGKTWHNLDAPRHLSFPNRKTAELMASKHGFTFLRQENRAFPNGIAGSLPVVFSGRFRFSLFLLFLPLGILISRVIATGTRAQWFKKTSIADALHIR